MASADGQPGLWAQDGPGGPAAQAPCPTRWVGSSVTCHSADAWPRFEGPAAPLGPGSLAGQLGPPPRRPHRPCAHEIVSDTRPDLQPPSPGHRVLWGPPSAESRRRPPTRPRTGWGGGVGSLSPRPRPRATALVPVRSGQRGIGTRTCFNPVQQGPEGHSTPRSDKPGSHLQRWLRGEGLTPDLPTTLLSWVPA